MSPLLRLSAQKNFFPGTTGSSSPYREAVAALLFVKSPPWKGQDGFFWLQDRFCSSCRLPAPHRQVHEAADTS